MNLADVMVAVLLFSLASAGCLDVMASLGRTLQGSAQAEAAAARLETELRRSQAVVRAGADQEQATDLACDQPELLLSRLLMDGSSSGNGAPGEPSGATRSMQREVNVVAPGLVRLQLTDGGRWQRQRLFSAAAYGLCPSLGGPIG
jgi:type II secretory pathway component PulJ